MSTVLVAGASGLLGGVVTRKLLQSGFDVRALGRNRDKLAELERFGAEVYAVDLLDEAAIREACVGVNQIVATANNILGKGARSPLRVDVPAYENLLAMAKEAGVERFVYVSFRGATPDSAVDFFRIKFALEGIVQRSGIPYVIVRPTAFMDIWAEVIFGKTRTPRSATLFGGGRRVVNFVAVEDVADFISAIVARPEVINEVIEVGGPTNATFGDYATMVERSLGRPLKRHAIPKPVMGLGRRIVRPFHEVAARMMSMGYWTQLEDRPFAEWAKSADRFGVSPRSLETFVEERFGSH